MADMPQSEPQGVSQIIADTNSGLMQLMELMQGKYPEIAQKLGAVVQGFQGVIDELSEPEGAPAQGQPMPATTTPEAGAAKVQPAM